MGVEEQERRVAWVVLRDHRPPSLECLLPHLAWLFTLMVCV